MHRRHTDAGYAPPGRLPWARCTPLAATSAWAAAVAAGAVWAPFAHVASPMAAMGETLLAVLALHALHEAGHVLAGLAVGAPLQSLTLGVLTVHRERRGGSGRFRLAFNRSWRRFAGCVEREVYPAPGLREALTVSALGGPVASVAGGAAVLYTAPAEWAGFGAASVLVGLLNALPVTVFGQASDGMIVRRLWGRRLADVVWRAEVCGTPTWKGMRAPKTASSAPTSRPPHGGPERAHP